MLGATLAFEPGVARAQTTTLGVDVLFYGDNTEFRNPFREGETLFGAAARAGVEVDLNEKTRLTLGAFGHTRFGSERAFELARPVVALTVKGRRSTFIFGTLPAPRADAPGGPDRGGPHGLLPPLQRETLAFDRPYEAGLQWDFSGARLRHSMWLDWQRLNTPGHRERFDAGLNGSVIFTPHVSMPIQLHVVHEGGQLFNTGPVADSVAAALGIAIGGKLGPLDRVSIEVLGAAGKSVPDRERINETRRGKGFFARASVECQGWRAHTIAWRGWDYVKDEGDLNYLSVRRDGTRYFDVRDYAEAGLSRRFALAPGAAIEVSGRLHRTERHYEYSYRVLSVTAVRWRLR